MSDKVKKALEERNARKKKENESFEEKQKNSQDKINAALKERENRIKSNLQSTYPSLDNRYFCMLV